jgi:hypothetical protein
MNVAVKVVDIIEAGSAAPKKRKTLVVTKDFTAGDVIYKVDIVIMQVCGWILIFFSRNIPWLQS